MRTISVGPSFRTLGLLVFWRRGPRLRRGPAQGREDQEPAAGRTCAAAALFCGRVLGSRTCDQVAQPARSQRRALRYLVPAGLVVPEAPPAFQGRPAGPPPSR